MTIKIPYWMIVAGVGGFVAGVIHNHHAIDWFWLMYGVMLGASFPISVWWEAEHESAPHAPAGEAGR